MARHPSPFDHQFNKLLVLHRRGEAEELFTELLRHGHSICNPLADFLLKHPGAPELSILIDLLSKCMDDRAVPLLMRFLDSGIAELRRAAANGLGWHRARVALEALDELEGTDPDNDVRLEARLAIDEILRDFPKLRSLLHYHEPMNRPQAAIAGEHERIPGATTRPDSEQRLELIRCLPRLLALKYNAVPIHVSPAKLLHLGVPSGSEKRLVEPLSTLTGRSVQLHSWTRERIRQAIEELYSLGDDDFCTFHQELTPGARDEVVEAVLAGVRPAEPASPLAETSDAVEAVQAFLTSCECMKLDEVDIRYAPPEMTLEGRRADGSVYTLDAPPEGHRERFLSALRIVARLEPGAGLEHQRGGVIRCCQHAPHFTAHVEALKALEGETLRVRLERPALEA